MELTETIIQGGKWLGTVGLAIYGGVESYRIYCKRKEVEAKEASINVEAVRKLTETVTKQDIEIANLKHALELLGSRDESIKDIVTKLENNYTGLLSRLLDQYGRGSIK